MSHNRYRPTDDDDDGRHDYDKHNNHDGGGDYQDDHLYFGVVHSSNNLTMSGITLRGAPTKEAKHNINITPIIIITNLHIIRHIWEDRQCSGLMGRQSLLLHHLHHRHCGIIIIIITIRNMIIIHGLQRHRHPQ